MTIEKKNFVTPPVKTPAASLAQRHLGSLVTITLPSGAEVTDILRGVRAGDGSSGVVINMVNVRRDAYDPTATDFILEPKSVVLVRRPKAVKAAKK